MEAQRLLAASNPPAITACWLTVACRTHYDRISNLTQRLLLSHTSILAATPDIKAWCACGTEPAIRPTSTRHHSRPLSLLSTNRATPAAACHNARCHGRHRKSLCTPCRATTRARILRWPKGLPVRRAEVQRRRPCWPPLVLQPDDRRGRPRGLGGRSSPVIEER